MRRWLRASLRSRCFWREGSLYRVGEKRFRILFWMGLGDCALIVLAATSMLLFPVPRAVHVMMAVALAASLWAVDELCRRAAGYDPSWLREFPWRPYVDAPGVLGTVQVKAPEAWRRIDRQPCPNPAQDWSDDV